VSTTCGFPVLVELEGKFKEIPTGGGKVKLLFPSYEATLTNQATGNRIGDLCAAIE
jgi:hypothetical protein